MERVQQNADIHQHGNLKTPPYVKQLDAMVTQTLSGLVFQCAAIVSPDPNFT